MTLTKSVAFMLAAGLLAVGCATTGTTRTTSRDKTAKGAGIGAAAGAVLGAVLGEGEAIADNATADGRARNRRVTILLKAKAKSSC